MFGLSSTPFCADIVLDSRDLHICKDLLVSETLNSLFDDLVR